MPEPRTAALHADGIAVLHGMEAAIAAIDAGIRAGRAVTPAAPALLRAAGPGAVTLSEAEAKAALAAHGLAVPRSVTGATAAEMGAAAAGLSFPVALKGLGIAHKTEAGAVRLNLATPHDVDLAARAMPGAAGFLAEEMVTGAVTELLVGVTRDPTGLMLLTLGAGGIMAELLADTASILLPATADDIRAALGRLKAARVLAGWRGRPGADLGAVVAAVQAVAAYAASEPRLLELDVNPLIATPTRAVAVDALIRLTEE
jgi:acyl-CoA synthetase (NDP forming)